MTAPRNSRILYDAPRTRMIGLEGLSSPGIQTWELRSGTWVKVGPVFLPAPGANRFVYYDPVVAAPTYLSVNLTTRNSSTEVYHWRVDRWIKQPQVIVGPPLPSPLVYYTFDTTRNRLVATNSSQVVEWTGSGWEMKDTQLFPERRFGAGFAYDSASSRCVLVGGYTSRYSLRDTWEWDGRSWRERFPIHRPDQLTSGSAVGTPRGLYLFGGTDSQVRPMAETWRWDGRDWEQVFPRDQPARRYSAALAYDSARERILLFGGSAPTQMRDTWEYTFGIRGSYRVFGRGCAGTRGIPTLAAVAGSAPTAGREIRVQLSGLPLSGAAWMFLGASNSRYGSVALPLDLASIGMPGCSLRVSGDQLSPVRNVLGVGLWSARVPLPAMGGTFYNQAIVEDRSSTTLGLTVSDAAEARVGG